MIPTAMLIAALILLPAFGLVTWALFAMAQVEEDLRSFSRFEGMHFEIGPQGAQDAEGARWPIPG